VVWSTSSTWTTCDDPDLKSGKLRRSTATTTPSAKSQSESDPAAAVDPTKVSVFHSQIVRMNQFNLRSTRTAPPHATPPRSSCCGASIRSRCGQLSAHQHHGPLIRSSRSAAGPDVLANTTSRPTSRGRCRTSRRTASSATTTPPCVPVAAIHVRLQRRSSRPVEERA